MIIKILKTCRRLNTIFIDLHNVKAYKKGGSRYVREPLGNLFLFLHFQNFLQWKLCGRCHLRFRKTHGQKAVSCGYLFFRHSFSIPFFSSNFLVAYISRIFLMSSSYSSSSSRESLRRSPISANLRKTGYFSLNGICSNMFIFFTI